MTTSIAINGFGRIGRMVFRQMIMEESFSKIVVNASYPPETLAHLIKYDTTHGIFDGDVRVEDGDIVVNGKHVTLLSERDPLKLPWKELGIDIVIEATGVFNARDKAAMHLEAGAKK